MNGTIGIGHTRWATHGRPTEENAHPHTDCKGEIVVVHNGIIENYVELKKELTAKGHTFKSQTDTEVLAHMVEEAYDGKDLAAAVRAVLKQVHGSYAVAVLTSKDHTRVIAARKDSPLVLGIGEGEMFVASDVPAILQHTRRVIFLEDGDVAELTQKDVKITNLDGKPIQRNAQTIIWDSVMAEKGGYKHFMLKEIYEQVVTVRDTFRSRINLEEGRVDLEDVLPAAVAKKRSRKFVSSAAARRITRRLWRGSGWKSWPASLCDVEIASEFRYRRSKKDSGTLIVAITQSGETADTLAAMKDSKAKGLPTLALCNAVGSTATRDADYTLMTHCGPEIGVASTKAFTGQLTALFLLALYIGQSKGTISKDAVARDLLCRGFSICRSPSAARSTKPDKWNRWPRVCSAKRTSFIWDAT